ncbi:hypothetical protein LCGC14_1485450, partial [marine sediment metagenome]
MRSLKSCQKVASTTIFRIGNTMFINLPYNYHLNGIN